MVTIVHIEAQPVTAEKAARILLDAGYMRAGEEGFNRAIGLMVEGANAKHAVANVKRAPCRCVDCS
jgi:hypothetical protein